MKENIKLKTESKEYPEMTFDQLKRMVDLMNQGLTEQEARERVLNNA